MTDSDENDANYQFQCRSKITCSIPYHSVANYDESEWVKVIESWLSNGGPAVPYIDPDSMTYQDFFNKHLMKNIPCMFSPKVTASWESRQAWVVRTDEEEKINFDKLTECYGNAPVSVQNCDDQEYKDGYGTRDCRDMTFREYMEYFQRFEDSNVGGLSKLYLKDWHIVKYHEGLEIGSSKLPYECPAYFRSDWLNEFSAGTEQDDYKFCYMGPAGTFTSFHADVYGSYSWSANVVGVKKWYLYPPGKEMRFYDDRLKKLVFRWEDPGIAGKDFVEVIQSAGECLFVPSGWHHVVWNLTDAISINHNWFNGTNLCFIWSCLKNALEEVKHELDDLRDIPEFHEQCQLVLKANHGLDYGGFFEIIRYIRDNRVQQVERMKGDGMEWNLRYDLAAIEHLMREHCSQDDTVKKHFLNCLDASFSVIDR